MCLECETGIDELEIGISPDCAVDRGDFLCDRLHTAEEIARIRLSRGREPWRADIHFDVRDVYYGSDKYGFWLPWLQFHYFGPFDWPREGVRPHGAPRQYRHPILVRQCACRQRICLAAAPAARRQLGIDAGPQHRTHML
jgi:hypothetical protein